MIWGQNWIKFMSIGTKSGQYTNYGTKNLFKMKKRVGSDLIMYSLYPVKVCSEFQVQSFGKNVINRVLNFINFYVLQ